MKIIHLSDLHLDTLFKRGNIRKTRQLIEQAVEEGFDHLVISGDVSDNGKVSDFKLLKKILAKHNLLDSNKVTITIGNHDIFGGVQTALDVVNFTSKCRRVKYNDKVTRFGEHFKDLFAGAYHPLPESAFPFAKVVGEFVFVGINTNDIYSRIKNPLASTGKVYKDQFEAIEKILSLPEFVNKRRVIVSHHHFYKNSVEATSSQSRIWNRIESYTLRLRGKKKLIQLFVEHGVELVLHGHSHDVREYKRKGIQFVNAGGAIDNNSKFAKFISVKFDRRGISVKIKSLKTKPSLLRKYNKHKKLVPGYSL